MRVGLMAALIILNYVFQSTVLVRITILGVQPDTALIFIVSYAMLRGDVEGAIFGFFAGLMHDMFGGYAIGLYAMLGMLTGFVAGKPFKDFFRDNYFLPLILVVAAAILYQFMFFVTSILFRGHLDFGHYFMMIILPKTVYTAVLAVPLYSLMYAINKRVEAYESVRRNMFEE